MEAPTTARTVAVYPVVAEASTATAPVAKVAAAEVTRLVAVVVRPAVVVVLNRPMHKRLERQRSKCPTPYIGNSDS